MGIGKRHNGRSVTVGPREFVGVSDHHDRPQPAADKSYARKPTRPLGPRMGSLEKSIIDTSPRTSDSRLG